MKKLFLIIPIILLILVVKVTQDKLAEDIHSVDLLGTNETKTEIEIKTETENAKTENANDNAKADAKIDNQEENLILPENESLSKQISILITGIYYR